VVSLQSFLGSPGLAIFPLDIPVHQFSLFCLQNFLCKMHLSLKGLHLTDQQNEEARTRCPEKNRHEKTPDEAITGGNSLPSNQHDALCVLRWEGVPRQKKLHVLEKGARQFCFTNQEGRQSSFP